MEDLSLHILDIGENSIAAGATLIEIMIDEDTRTNKMIVKIKDNGRGLDEETRDKVLDPFFTTKTARRVGLGLPLLAQAAREADGNLKIDSQPGKGTLITAEFIHNHFDRKPLGDMAATLVTLIKAKGTEIDFIYSHRKNSDGFQFDTREIKEELQEVPIDNPDVLNLVGQTIRGGLKDLEKETK